MNFLKKLICRHRTKRVVATFDTKYKPGQYVTKLVIVCDGCGEVWIREKPLSLQEVDEITKTELLPKLREEIEQRNHLIDLLQRRNYDSAGQDYLLGDGSYIDIPSHYGNN